ncbi:hypothetical protein F383_15822 [Gossypium arboreum]|uniref:Uncharacterized protein n=1 Tax=Gossypium arboreum TaxID=29729 RepID=A0A0B0ME60_GOSAR|nr:hypothetical protein F383_15822 [Gossypium arboreum]
MKCPKQLIISQDYFAEPSNLIKDIQAPWLILLSAFQLPIIPFNFPAELRHLEVAHFLSLCTRTFKELSLKC